MLDCHCHLLPGVDDGPPTLDEALALCRALVGQGITEAVTTPHWLHPGFPLDEARVLAAHAALTQELASAGIALTVHLGAENHFNGELPVDRFLERARPMADSGVLLIELPETSLPLAAWDLCFEVLRRGGLPLIAHVERHPALVADLDRLDRFHCQGGGLLQLSADQLGGGLALAGRKRAARQVAKVLRPSCVVASDAHDTRRRPPTWDRLPDRERELVPASLAALAARRPHQGRGSTGLTPWAASRTATAPSPAPAAPPRVGETTPAPGSMPVMPAEVEAEPATAALEKGRSDRFASVPAPAARTEPTPVPAAAGSTDSGPLAALALAGAHELPPDAQSAQPAIKDRDSSVVVERAAAMPPAPPARSPQPSPVQERRARAEAKPNGDAASVRSEPQVPSAALVAAAPAPAHTGPAPTEPDRPEPSRSDSVRATDRAVTAAQPAPAVVQAAAAPLTLELPPEPPGELPTLPGPAAPTIHDPLGLLGPQRFGPLSPLPPPPGASLPQLQALDLPSPPRQVAVVKATREGLLLNLPASSTLPEIPAITQPAPAASTAGNAGEGTDFLAMPAGSTLPSIPALADPAPRKDPSTRAFTLPEDEPDEDLFGEGDWPELSTSEPSTRVVQTDHGDLSQVLARIGPLRQKAETALVLDRPAQAVAALDEAVSLLSVGPRPLPPAQGAALARIQRLLAKALVGCSRLDDAETALRSAVALADASNDRLGVVRATYEQARLFAQRGNQHAAAAALEAGRSLVDSIGDDRLLLSWLSALGKLLRRLRRHAEAEPVLIRALTLAQVRKQTAEQLSLRDQLARCRAHLGDGAGAEKLHWEQIAQCGAGDDRERWTAQYRLGVLLVQRRAAGEAVLHLREALTGFSRPGNRLRLPEPLPRMQVQLARCLLLQKRYEDALMQFRTAEHALDPLDQATPSGRRLILTILKGQANCCWKLKRHLQARELLAQALAQARELGGEAVTSIEQALAKLG